MKKILAIGLIVILGLSCIPIGMTLRVGYGFVRQNVQTEKHSGDKKVVTVENLRFDEREETNYDLYYPEDLSGDASLILYIHGGGFTGGSKNDGKSLCKTMASRGYVAATIEYTLASEEHPSNIPMLCEEVDDCIKAVKQYCADMGIEIKDMAMSGASAGAILSMLYGTKYADNSAIPLKCIFQMSGPTTFEPTVWGCETAEQQLTFAQMMTGVTMDEEDFTSGKMMEYVKEISPALLVDENIVPVLGAYGAYDNSPANKNEDFFAALDRYSVEYQIIDFPNSGHALLNDPKAMDEYITTAIEWCEKYLDYGN